MTSGYTSSDLEKLYRNRFEGKSTYRTRVWGALANFFGRWIAKDARVLDVGAGYCEAINAFHGSAKYAMDLNPETAERANPDVQVMQQNCCLPWSLNPGSLDVIFSSNFLEHLPDKAAVSALLNQAFRSLRPGGRIILLGPNIRFVQGEYWDFFDHHVALTDRSLKEALVSEGFTVEYCAPRFLPYTMSDGREYPLVFLRLYLRMPWAWRIFGKQFLVVASKP